jgi:prolyl-tRNA synthetase
MGWSQSFIPTLRDDPADAEAISHKLMVRAGMVRQLAAGIYLYLPIGQRVLDKVNAIIREEMNAIGGQEITMPVLHPAEIWRQSGRWGAIGDEMFRLKDRNQHDLCLGMTHEEVVAWLASKEIRSYRDLPQIWYQIQTKERDEVRPRSGVLRTREFLMKDSYTLDRDEADLNSAYERHLTAYRRIFERCGLRYHVVASDPGMMGGAGAHEFMAPSPVGEDEVALCPSCGYAANVELARSVTPKPKFPAWTLEEVATPSARTIDEVSNFLKVPKTLTIKSLLYIGKDGPLLALVRGDQELHEKKLAKVAGDVRPAHPDEVRSHMGASPGSVGPVGASVTILADDSLKDGVYVVGANKDGYHLRGVRPGQDFQTRFLDLHVARAGDDCAECGKPLTVERVIEVGNIFKLGTKYSVPFHAFYLDQDGQERPIVMGSYGIGPARIVAAAIEQHHDTNGIIWSWSITPFQVHLLAVNVNEPLQRDTAEELYRSLIDAGFELFLDDRNERPGVKFKDADLIGAPIRITVGTSFVKDGTIEIRLRRDGSDRKVVKSAVVSTIKELAQSLQ